LHGKRILWFFLGAVCFIISQPLLRLPILQYLQSSVDFELAYTLNPLLIGVLIALSAGVFEEGFRFVFKRFLLKPDKCSFSQPIIFGLGHGVAEALIILLPVLSLVPVSQLGLAIFERIMAVILHINLTVLVWNGFQTKKRTLYLLTAILVHGFINSLIPILSLLPNSILMIEGALVFVNILLIGYSNYSRKYYLREENC
jgi:uncharacterized membrane protein YhfC